MVTNTCTSPIPDQACTIQGDVNEKIWSKFTTSPPAEQLAFFNHCLHPTYFITTGKKLSEDWMTDCITMTDCIYNSIIYSTLSDLTPFLTAPLIYNNLTFTDDTDTKIDADTAAIQWYLDQINLTIIDQPPLTTDDFNTIFKHIETAKTTKLHNAPDNIWNTFSIRNRARMVELTRLPSMKHTVGNDYSRQLMTPTQTKLSPSGGQGHLLFLAGNTLTDYSLEISNLDKPISLTALAFGTELTYSISLFGHGSDITQLYVPNNSITKIDPSLFSQVNKPDDPLPNLAGDSTTWDSYGVPQNMLLEALHIGNDPSKKNLNTATISSDILHPDLTNCTCSARLKYINISSLPLTGATLKLPEYSANLIALTANYMQLSASWTLDNSFTKATNFSYMIRSPHKKDDPTQKCAFYLTSIKEAPSITSYKTFDAPYNGLEVQTCLDNALKSPANLIYLDLSYNLDCSLKPSDSNKSYSITGKTFTNLETCNLSCCNIGTFTGNDAPKLTSLQLNSNWMDSFVISTTYPSLVTLCVKNNPLATGFSINAILPKIAELDLSYPLTQPPPIYPSTTEFGSLTSLALNLTNLPKLSTLNASYHQLTSLQITGSSTFLTKINVSFNNLLANSSTTSKLSPTSLTCLDISANCMADKPDFTSLQSTQITNFYFYGNMITPTTATSIVNDLATNIHTTNLYYYINDSVVTRRIKLKFHTWSNTCPDNCPTCMELSPQCYTRA